MANRYEAPKMDPYGFEMGRNTKLTHNRSMESIIIVKGMLGGELVAHLLASQNRSADLEELTELMDLILNGSRVKKKILKERIREFETKIELIKFRSESGGDSQKGEGKKGKVHGGRVWLRRQSGY